MNPDGPPSSESVSPFDPLPKGFTQNCGGLLSPHTGQVRSTGRKTPLGKTLRQRGVWRDNSEALSR